uniref:Tripartite motif-containing protein 2-like n=1 Tax=Saccoglossus kowalevskii TaxID=10224 RepID=A0ABM0MYC4_SACKO|nr:PREDICTED: tripartite motif-containing protein 2-like [Saccoglossus kowalevskii]
MAAAASDVVDAGAVLAEINEDFLCCAICLERYSDPKILPCQHTFCKKCLVQLAEKGVADTLMCPTCNRSVKVPINDLQSNFFMSSLLDKIPEKLVAGTPKVCEFCEENEVTSICVECQQYSCTPCTRVHKKTKTTKSHQVLSVDEYQETKNKKPFAVQSIQYCNVHTGNQLKYYCDTCQTPICMECTIIDHRVPEHKHRYIKEVADEYSDELKGKVRKLKVKADEAETSKMSAKAACDKLKTCCKEEEAKINKKTDEILEDLRRQIEVVKQKKERLVDELKTEYTARVKNMEIKVDELEMKHGNIVKFRPHPGRDDVRMLATNACQQNCSLDNVPKQLIKGDTATLMVTTRDKQGKQVIPRQVVEARVTKPDGSSDDIKVQDNNDGTHTMMVHGEIDGKYKVSVTIDNQPIPGTPAQFNVIKGLVKTIGKNGSGKGEYNLPVGVTVDKNGDIVTAERGNKRLQITDKDGNYKNIIKIEKCIPSGLCIFNGKYYMTDLDNAQVVISDMNGHVIKRFSENMKHPIRIVVRPADGMVYVSDWDLKIGDKTNKDGHLIRKYTKDGDYIKSFGGYGSEARQFKGPSFMAVDNHGLLFVGDYNNNRIQVYNTDDEYMYSFNCPGQDEGQIYGPRGIAIDKEGYVYVVNYNNKVQKFDRSGRFICRIDKDTDGLNSPSDVAVTDDVPCRVVVVDRNNHCVKIFAQ